MRVLGLDDFDDAQRRLQVQLHQQQLTSQLSSLPPFLQQQQQQRLDTSRGFNLLLLIPIIIGALLALVLALWLLMRWWRKRKHRTELKRADSTLLPVVDPAALLSPASREYERQSPRGVALSFLSSTSPTTPSAQLQPSVRAACGSGGSRRGDITSAQSTVLYSVLQSDPNISAHCLAFHKIAFERRLSSHTSGRASTFQRSAKAACASPSASQCAAQRACETWLCQYEGEEIIVKMLARRSRRCDHAAHFEALQRLVDEVQLTASLEHANVVRFLGIAWDSTAIESLCMITEYLPAGDLQSMLRTSGTDASVRWSHRIMRTIRGVARALQYLHARSVVHRGVRAKNVVFSRLDSEPKLVNIGATRHYPTSNHQHRRQYGLEAHQLQLQSEYEHARFWTAPEVLSGLAVCSERSDIYAFGALLAEIDANGQLPYEEEDEEDNNTESCSVGRDDDGDNEEEEEKDSGMLVTDAVARTDAPSLPPRRRTPRSASAMVFSPECPPPIVELARLCLCAAPEQRVDASTLTELLESYVSSGDRYSVVTTGGLRLQCQ